MPKRIAFFFGNGLGMALKPEYFALSAGLESVWNGSEFFKEAHKQLVISAISGLSEDAFPKSEDQLDQLQVAIVAAAFLRGFETDTVKWLADSSRELPDAFRRFIHEVAAYFHNSGCSLPDRFIDSLSAFVQLTKSHVAVLNYDNLLYDGFTQRGILSGYNGALIDGFRESGFSGEYLDRYYPKRLGLYLHLHGSPLFVANRKLMRGERSIFVPHEQSQVVLTHVKHKPLVIDSYPILREYWARLHLILREAEMLVLFGYSGCDTHLNELLASACSNKGVCVVEWEGVGAESDRRRFWKEKLKSDGIGLVQLNNLLDFDSWTSL